MPDFARCVRCNMRSASAKHHLIRTCFFCPPTESSSSTSLPNGWLRTCSHTFLNSSLVGAPAASEWLRRSCLLTFPPVLPGANGTLQMVHIKCHFGLLTATNHLGVVALWMAHQHRLHRRLARCELKCCKSGSHSSIRGPPIRGPLIRGRSDSATTGRTGPTHINLALCDH